MAGEVVGESLHLMAPLPCRRVDDWQTTMLYVWVYCTVIQILSVVMLRQECREYVVWICFPWQLHRNSGTTSHRPIKALSALSLLARLSSALLLPFGVSPLAGRAVAAR